MNTRMEKDRKGRCEEEPDINLRCLSPRAIAPVPIQSPLQPPMPPHLRNIRPPLRIPLQTPRHKPQRSPTKLRRPAAHLPHNHAAINRVLLCRER